MSPVPALKVLHVAQTALGGVGSYLEEIVPLQAALYGAENVRAVLPAGHAAAFPALPTACLATYPDAPGRLAGTARMARRALGIAWRWQPDVVHLHSTFAGLALRPLLRLLPGRCAVVYCAHGWAFDRRGAGGAPRVSRSLERWLSPLCDRVVCVSRHDHERGLAAGIPAAKLRVVVNGIADRRPGSVSPDAAAWPADALRILFVGRLDAQKGVDVLLDAMRLLDTRAHAVVVGAAVAGAPCAHEDARNVRFAGWQPREAIERLHAAADVLVMPSRWEGLPIAALEAMRAGVPVVATRVGGIPEAVQDGVTGWLVDADAPAQLAATLAALDIPLLRAAGERARRRFVEAFRVERVVGELDGIYRELAPRPAALQEAA